MNRPATLAPLYAPAGAVQLVRATKPSNPPTNRPVPRSMERTAVGTVSAATASPPRSELEERLQYLLLVESRLAPPVMEEDVRQVLSELQRRRQERKAVIPTTRRKPRTLTGSIRPHVLALVQACEAPTGTEATEILSSFFRNHYSSSERGIGRSLVCTALAELLIKQKEGEESLRSALSLLDDAVTDQHVGAMLQVGLCLRDGIGVPNDLVAALTWMEHSASAGYAPAMFELGAMYEDGVVCECGSSLPSDWGAALEWYRLAAERGHTMAQLNIGKLLWRAASAAVEASLLKCNEKSVSGLQRKSREWLEKAATAGNEEAIRLLRH